MNQLAHFLAESANFNADGTFTVFRGGIAEVRAGGFPAPFRCVVVTRLQLDASEAAILHQLRIEVQFDGQTMGPGLTQPFATNPVTGSPAYANIITNFNIALAGPGELVFVANLDDVGLPLLRLQVVRV